MANSGTSGIQAHRTIHSTSPHFPSSSRRPWTKLFRLGSLHILKDLENIPCKLEHSPRISCQPRLKLNKPQKDAKNVFPISSSAKLSCPIDLCSYSHPSDLPCHFIHSVTVVHHPRWAATVQNAIDTLRPGPPLASICKTRACTSGVEDVPEHSTPN